MQILYNCFNFHTNFYFFFFFHSLSLYAVITQKFFIITIYTLTIKYYISRDSYKNETVENPLSEAFYFSFVDSRFRYLLTMVL